MNDVFSKSFLNRIDSVITFNSLDENIVKEIIVDNIKLLEQKYNVIIDYDDVIDDLVNKTNYLEFGARHVKDVIRKNVLNVLITNNKKKVKLKDTLKV